MVRRSNWLPLGCPSELLLPGRSPEFAALFEVISLRELFLTDVAGHKGVAVLVDADELEGWKGGVVCMTCQHFTYGVDQHCHTFVACNIRRKQLPQGDHLKKRCKLWAPTWQQQFGWAAEG